MTMNSTDIITLVLIVGILGGAILFLYRARKKGVKCVGCPDSGKCAGNCTGCPGSCDCQGKT